MLENCKKINTANVEPINKKLKKVQYNIPKLFQATSQSIPKQDKIDSMPQIAQNCQTFMQCCQAKKSQRLLGEKTMKDVKQSINNVLKNSFLQQNFKSIDGGFNRIVSKNLCAIKQLQMKRAVSNATKNVNKVLMNNDRNRNISFEQNKIVCNKQNIRNQNHSQDVQVCQINKKPKIIINVNSSKDISNINKYLTNQNSEKQSPKINQKSKSIEKKLRKTNKVINQNNDNLFEGINRYLHQNRKNRDDKVIKSIVKSKQQLQKKLKEIEQKLNQRSCPQNNNKKIINTTDVKNNPQWLKLEIQNREYFWNQSNFDKQIQKVKKYQKKNQQYIVKYIKNQQEIIKLQLRNK